MPKIMKCWTVTAGLGGIIIFRWLCIVAMTTLPVSISSAAKPALEIDEAVPVVIVEGYEVIGFNPLSDRATRKIVSEYTGTFSDLSAINDAAAALQDAIQKKGFTLHEVVVPPQPVSDGTIKLEVVGLVVDEIGVEGNNHYSDKNVRQTLPGLVVGETPNMRYLDISLQVANKNPRKRTNLKFLANPGHEEGLQTTLIVSDQRPYQFFAWANNTGTETTGNYRGGVGAQHANLFARDHVATVTYTTSPDEQEKVDQYGLSYKVPFYRAGGMLELIYAKSDIESGRVAGGFDVSGAGKLYDLAFTKYFRKRGRYTQSFVVGLSDRLFDNNIEFGGRRFDTDVRSRPVSLRYLGQYVGRKWVTDFFGSLYVNLVSGDFNDELSYNLARLGADSHWETVGYGLSTGRPIGNWKLSIGLVGQYADEPLIPGEQFGLGGLYSVRGFEEREVTSDRANWLTVQLAAPEKRGFTPLVFADIASGTRVEPLPSEIHQETLSSVGAGARWRSPHSKVNFDFYLGYVLNGTDPDGPGTTRDGDYHAHLNFVLRY